jgi:hypothetical protein
MILADDPSIPIRFRPTLFGSWFAWAFAWFSLQFDHDHILPRRVVSLVWLDLQEPVSDRSLLVS